MKFKLILDPLSPQDSEVIDNPNITTLFQAEQYLSPGGFVDATICLLDGEAIMRERWSAIRESDDVFEFVPVLGGTGVIIGVVVAVISVGVSLALAPKAPDIPKVIKPPNKAQTFAPSYSSSASIMEPDPVFELSGQRNKAKLGHPVEVSYGRPRNWPSYGASPYNQFAGEDQQSLYQLFCLGQGTFSDIVLQIEDTSIDNFSEVVYEIYQPGQEVTLFPDNIFTNTEVNGTEMFGPNEAEYTEWIGPYAVNPATTVTTEIQIDITLPGGLNNQTESGGLSAVNVAALWEYREINDYGGPVAGATWQTLGTFSKTLATIDTKRYTLFFPVTAGRYEVRGHRTDDKSTNYRVTNTVTWYQLRAFLPSKRVYPGKTMLAVKSRATNQLNDSSSNRINFFGTREVPIYDPVSETWSANTATRNPMWAAMDVLRSTYGGNVPDNCLDLVEVARLADIFDISGDTFDWVFESRSTVWEILKAIGRTVRSVPYVKGHQITFFRDDPQAYPVAMFMKHNIKKDTITLDTWLPSSDDSDGVEVEYVSPLTWKKETIKCLLPGDSGVNTDKISLSGVTDRDRAYRLGMYLRSVDKLGRKALRFEVLKDGLTVNYGRRFMFAHSTGWGVTGYVVRQLSDTVIQLSEELDFSGGDVVLSIRDKSGSVVQSIPVTAVAGDTFAVQLNGYIDWASTTLGKSGEPPYFIAGVEGQEKQDFRLVSLAPTKEKDVRIVAVNYTDDVFLYDSATAPAAVDEGAAVTYEDLPAVTGLTVAAAGGSVVDVQALWDASDGAISYLVEYSYDPTGEGWEFHERTSATSSTIPVSAGTFYVRVAAINVGLGAFAEWTGEVGVATQLPLPLASLRLSTPFIGNGMQVNWDSVSSASSYEVTVKDGATVKRVEDTANTSYEYTISDATTDGSVKRIYTISVKTENAIGLSPDAVEISATNPAPIAVTTLSSSFLGVTATHANYRVNITPLSDIDIESYKFFVETTSGFTPAAGNLYTEGLFIAMDISIALDGSGNHAAQYWVVAAKDVWGAEANYSAEQTIAAYTA